MDTSRPPARIALIGDHDPAVVAHRGIPLALGLAAGTSGQPVDWAWLHTSTLARRRDGAPRDVRRHLVRAGQPVRQHRRRARRHPRRARARRPVPRHLRRLPARAARVRRRRVGRERARARRARSVGGRSRDCAADLRPRRADGDDPLRARLAAARDLRRRRRGRGLSLQLRLEPRLRGAVRHRPAARGRPRSRRRRARGGARRPPVLRRHAVPAGALGPRRAAPSARSRPSWTPCAPTPGPACADERRRAPASSTASRSCW